jgi:hypothetical protein
VLAKVAAEVIATLIELAIAAFELLPFSISCWPPSATVPNKATNCARAKLDKTSLLNIIKHLYHLSNFFKANCQKNQQNTAIPNINSGKFSCFDSPSSTINIPNAPVDRHPNNIAKPITFELFMIIIEF